MTACWSSPCSWAPARVSPKVHWHHSAWVDNGKSVCARSGTGASSLATWNSSSSFKLLQKVCNIMIFAQYYYHGTRINRTSINTSWVQLEVASWGHWVIGYTWLVTVRRPSHRHCDRNCRVTTFIIISDPSLSHDSTLIIPGPARADRAQAHSHRCHQPGRVGASERSRICSG